MNGIVVTQEGSPPSEQGTATSADIVEPVPAAAAPVTEEAVRATNGAKSGSKTAKAATPVEAIGETVEAAAPAPEAVADLAEGHTEDGAGQAVPQTPEAPAPADLPADEAEPPAGNRTTVMLLGSGELAKELAISFQRLGAEVIVVDTGKGGPAQGVADRAVLAPIGESERLYELIEKERPRFVVPLVEAASREALDKLAEGRVTQVIPTAKAVRLAGDREGMRRLAAEELGLPTPTYWFANSVEELRTVLETSGFPAVVRPVAAAYGQGQSVVLRDGDVPPAWEQAIAANIGGGQRVMVETAVDIDYEITLLTVRTAGIGGATRLYFCEPIAHRQSGTDAMQMWQPQPLSQAALELARSIAARAVNALGGHGVYGVELFVRGDEVYFCDVSARPYDSGLVTVRSQRLSEYDMHARAVLGAPVDTILVSPAAAEVVYGDGDGPSPRQLDEALQTPESDLRVFGHSEAHRRRRVAVALATAPNTALALNRAQQVARHLR
ncbi:formate-dependent phosphoribosylglycinamide formyltransferase [Mycobacteroides abscessus]|uniref:formate-dependent phosphoribosylglycinamide formyltransferase n=1 Tax=Mycobacteroides abscessus TaxID=36809 RepID=UPI000926DD38|nr:formate-dependent phosphoribosylglycinamide formyltransferase [Mycobacteroides abscessus]MBN7454465.1 formate-dependent phosphoribosylglycinamide formyltransferase [Mycobacteroides abscessus subsp. abscessus]MBN7545045.1 formate-dependent phosphoribosylglycinamide formyltransferase [Mycobacteroides abscessus subsp. abscessus]MBN7567843.1 formate-dependent phosphoribosylglycinamide formyltransferase [Mycobacteroides abscessus subsp. abscessus]MDO3128657.1 formate-dependent phosphoribosylglyci